MINFSSLNLLKIVCVTVFGLGSQGLFALDPDVSIAGGDRTVFIGGSFDIGVAASDPDGFVVSIDLDISNGSGDSLITDNDATFPFSFSIGANQLIQTGNYIVTVTATDNDGDQEMATATYTVVSTSPVVVIEDPVDGRDFSLGSSFTLDVRTIDIDGNLNELTLERSGFPIATVTPSATGGTNSFTVANDSVGNFTLTATARDDAGNITVSDPVINYSVSDSVAPTITLLSPADGSEFSVGTSVEVFFSASDTDGVVDEVILFRGNSIEASTTSVGTTNSLSLVNIQQGGVYDYTLYAIDEDGISSTAASFSLEFTIPDAPLASVSSPSGGDAFTVGDTVTINAGVTSSGLGISGDVTVDFFINDVLLGSTSTFPYQFIWEPISSGTFDISVSATETGFFEGPRSAAVTVSVTANQAPEVDLFVPSEDITEESAITLSAFTTDVDGSITGVSFFADGVLIGSGVDSSGSGNAFTIQWIPLGTGTFEITAVATDDSGNRTTSTGFDVDVLGPVDLAPLASLVIEPNNESARYTVGSTLSLLAIAEDVDGTIARVEFYADGLQIKSDTSAPFAADHRLSEFGDGVTNFDIVVVDDDGNIVTSSAVVFPRNASGLGLEVEILSPVDSDSVLTGTTVALQASVTSFGDDFEAIQFYGGDQFLGQLTSGDIGEDGFFTLETAFTSAGIVEIFAIAYNQFEVSETVGPDTETFTWFTTRKSEMISVTVEDSLSTPSVALRTPAPGSTVELGEAVIFFLQKQPP